MLKKTLLLTAASLGFSGAALAHPPQWAPAHGHRMHEYRMNEYRVHEYYRPYVVAPRPVYVVPAPRVVYAQPAPVVVPAPVYAVPAPVYGVPGVSIRFNLPL